MGPERLVSWLNEKCKRWRSKPLTPAVEREILKSSGLTDGIDEIARIKIPISVETISNDFGLRDFLLRISGENEKVDWPVSGPKAAEFISGSFDSQDQAYECAYRYFKLGLVETTPSKRKGWRGKEIKVLSQEQFLALASLVCLRIRRGWGRESPQSIVGLAKEFLGSHPLSFLIKDSEVSSLCHI